MPSQTFTYVLLCGLAIALLWVIVTDLKSRTISNRLTLAIAAGAPLFWLSTGLSPWPGIAIQLGLAVVVFAICCALFAIRQMGGGDVKLLTALALWIAPSQFALLLLAMAMLGWVLTMAVGAWRVAKSNVPHTHPMRDAVLLVLGTGMAAVFASAVLGGPTPRLPAGLAEQATSSPGLAVALIFAPFVALLVVTLGSIRIIRRHESDLWVPYGPAISLAGIWILASGGMLVGSAFAGGG